MLSVAIQVSKIKIFKLWCLKIKEFEVSNTYECLFVLIEIVGVSETLKIQISLMQLLQRWTPVLLLVLED